eukprot:6046464-Prymnesium_polylepis.1
MVGSPVCITTEPSGTLSIGIWMPDMRDVHGAVSFLPRPGIMADLDFSFTLRRNYATLVQEFDAAGLLAKHCAGHDLSSSVPGLKSNFNIPQVLILPWEYELKTTFTADECCIVKELFGSGQRFGYNLHLLGEEMEVCFGHPMWKVSDDCQPAHRLMGRVDCSPPLAREACKLQTEDSC